jgi:hypothetical protein
MLIAEELAVRWEQVRVEQLDYGIQAGDQPGSFSNRHGAQFAGGSTNISDGWQPLREAGAQVRALLIAAAAPAWSAAPGSLSARDGVVHHADGRSATYGELAARAAKLPPPAGPFALKDPRDFRIIGHPAKTADGADIVSGRARYGIDASVPAMLIWTRADDLQNDFYRPFGVHRLRAALGADGRVLGWSHRIAATSRKFRSDMADAPDWVGTLDVDGFPAGCVPNYLAEFMMFRSDWRAAGGARRCTRSRLSPSRASSTRRPRPRAAIHSSCGSKCWARRAISNTASMVGRCSTPAGWPRCCARRRGASITTAGARPDAAWESPHISPSAATPRMHSK